MHDVCEGELAVPTKHYHPLRKKEKKMLIDVHHLVDLKFNYLIAMDEVDEDIDVGKNEHLLDL